MNTNKELINFQSSFTYGWEVVKKHWPFLLGIGVLTILITFPFSMVQSFWDSGSEFNTLAEMFLYVLFVLVFWVISVTIKYNTFKISLDIYHGKEPGLGDLFQMPNMNTVKYFAACAIYMLLVVAGLIAFIIPGIYFALKYLFVPTLIVDKNMGILEAAEKSRQMTSGEKWQLFAFFFLLEISCIGIIFVGLVCLIIGVIPAAFIATWITTFATLSVYKSLLHNKA